ncbi:MAG: hypothetical protein JXB88_08850, partial [Spirochaetales bacterium]|nr:hypothetical protein [Spirochaetales bacterium]
MDLDEQRKALSAYYSDGTNGNPYPANDEQLGDNPDPAAHSDWSPREEDETDAPGTESNEKWFNYLFGIYNPETRTYDHLMINGTRYNPYLPGLSTWKQFDPNQNNYVPSDTKRSAGVECVGFVQRCASYEGNPYAAIDINSRCIWGGGMPTLMYGEDSFSSDEYSWLIEDRNLLIPGDVLIGNGHIAMVLRIVYLGNSRIIDFNVNGTTDDVTVIESTKGRFNVWKVMNTNTWLDLG